ncbi:unnamed protein product [Rotaria sp. Silwood1]|nr:unnamed protein product [Rotaria sp. Silwood1]CAF1598785.1 unnamed protein product [Rotaria sp. Silwood1]CAF3753318.1 unnamed protein product [Rotaria sp. Silwood1]CAF4893418.1 unnamed protein product [Rotaria sp. Silwood1]CAF4963592.1 unnamed protein product [Rotaria sp. Silwood1]
MAQDESFIDLINHSEYNLDSYNNDLDKTTLIPDAENSSDDKTSSSGISSNLTTSSASSDQQSSVMYSDPKAQLFEQIMASLNYYPLMKVYKSYQFVELAVDLYQKDTVIQKEWARMIDYYKNDLKCNDDSRIKFEFCKCIDAIMNDERKIMIGLDSTEIVKDVLITCMRICSEPDFKLEIRVGLGGTTDSLTVRTPSYAVAGIALLYRLLELSKYFLSNIETCTGIVSTRILHNPPLLIFYSAYSVAVEVNKIDEKTAKKIANDILSYIRAYINEYHPDLATYVRYGMDHSNTYQPYLLDRIIKLFISNCHDPELLNALTNHADAHGGTMEGSIKYASTHSIGFRDVIDKKNSYSLFNPLNQDEANIQFNQEIYLPDCIISVGGSVERRFGQVRQIIRQAFKESLQMNDEDNDHLPLSIRMLSQAGQTPVYYHHSTHEITLESVLNSSENDLYKNEKIPRAVKEDLIIMTDDIGIRILKAMLEGIPTNKLFELCSWENCVSTLTELCSKTLEEHAKDENRRCQCSKEITEPVAQFFEHYGISNYLNDHRRSIISCIIDCLESEKRKKQQKQERNQKKKESRIQYAINNSRLRSGSEPLTQSVTNDLRLRSDSASSTKSTASDLRLHSDSASSTESTASDLRLRSDSASSTESTASDLRLRSDSQTAGRETMNNINKQLRSIICSIFVAFIKEFDKKYNNQKQMNNDKWI